ncbi:MAG: TPM domain-containing protein [Chitinophagaceae bacterium]|nr:TPM domain-containing protein [Chitinophagaceae bacterium]
MKRILGLIALLISFCASAQDGIPAPPAIPRLVNDFTGKFLAPEQVSALEYKLRAYNDSTSNQVVIAVVESLGSYSADDYAVELGRKWKVGNKDFNNGVVILISTGGGEGNRKAAIQVGYGLEGVITDLVTKSIIDNDIIPNFKAGNYYRGLDMAVDDIMTAAAGRYKAPAGWGQGKKPKGIGFGAILLILIILFLFSGRGGGKGGGMVSRRGYRDIGAGWILGSLLSGGSSGGGGWSGGGGGGGGGGFGGFGGGGFGGGGSSGSW